MHAYSLNLLLATISFKSYSSPQLLHHSEEQHFLFNIFSLLFYICYYLYLIKVILLKSKCFILSAYFPCTTSTHLPGILAFMVASYMASA